MKAIGGIKKRDSHDSLQRLWHRWQWWWLFPFVYIRKSCRLRTILLHLAVLILAFLILLLILLLFCLCCVCVWLDLVESISSWSYFCCTNCRRHRSRRHRHQQTRLSFMMISCAEYTITNQWEKLVFQMHTSTYVCIVAVGLFIYLFFSYRVHVRLSTFTVVILLVRNWWFTVFFSFKWFAFSDNYYMPFCYVTFWLFCFFFLKIKFNSPNELFRIVFLKSYCQNIISVKDLTRYIIICVNWASLITVT